MGDRGDRLHRGASVRARGRLALRTPRRTLAAAGAALLLTGGLAVASAAGLASPAAAAASCTFNGQASGSVIQDVTPGTTKVSVSCSGLAASSSYILATASPLAGVLPPSAGISADLAVLMGSFTSAASDKSGNLNLSYTVPSQTVGTDPDAVCNPTQAQVDAGLQYCALAVADFSGNDYGTAFLNYKSSTPPTPDAPKLSLSPTSGPTGTSVTASGTGWWGDATDTVPIPASDITVGGAQASASSVSVSPAVYDINSGDNGGTLHPPSIGGSFKIPGSAPTGEQTVTIAEPNTSPVSGTVQASATFDVQAVAGTPTVTGISPTTGPHAGGTTVTITGTNFAGASAVKFGGSEATSFTVVSPTSITATSPAGSGTVDVTVTTPGGTSATSFADEFTYQAAPQVPTVTGVSPDAGFRAGGAEVRISGSGFTGATSVKFGNAKSRSFTVSSDDAITATSPHGHGVVDVTVTTPVGTSSTTPADQFTYVLSPSKPIVTAINPAAGPAGGGGTISIIGEKFTGVVAVDFGSTPAVAHKIDNRLVSATVPPGTGTVDVTVTTPAGTSATSPADRYTYAPAPSQSAGPGRYYPLAPDRLLDTRNGTGAPKGQLGPGQSLDLQVTGRDGIPSSATAVVLNVTVTDTTEASYLTVWPQGQPRPTASNINFVAGQTVPNLVEVALGPTGGVSIFNDLGSTNVIADVEGYVDSAPSPGSTAGLYDSLNPTRILDTRTSNGDHEGSLGPGQSLDLQVTGRGGVPPEPGVSAVVLNVTVTDTTAPSFLTVWPQGDPRPLASNLNFEAGETVPNRVIVPVGPSGQISIYNDSGSANVVVDVGGWFTDGSNPAATGDYFVPAPTPTRILNVKGGPSDNIRPNTSIDLQVTGSQVPAGADAVVANMTATDTTASSFLTVYPAGTSLPIASDLNWNAGETVANLVVTKLSQQGTWSLYNDAGSTDAIADVAGWYLPSS